MSCGRHGQYGNSYAIVQDISEIVIQFSDFGPFLFFNLFIESNNKFNRYNFMIQFYDINLLTYDNIVMYIVISLAKFTFPILFSIFSLSGAVTSVCPFLKDFIAV